MQTKDIQTTSPEPRTFTQKADSGNEMTRAWCDGCGAGVWLRSASKPGLTFLKAGESDGNPSEPLVGWWRSVCMSPQTWLWAGLVDDSEVLIETIPMAGLFEPGDIPNPTMENWLKNMEPWETPAKGTKKTAQAGFD